MTQIDEKWDLFNAEYSLPNSMVDIGEVYHWAHYWHDKAKALRTISIARLGDVVDALLDNGISDDDAEPAAKAALTTLGITVEK